MLAGREDGREEEETSERKRERKRLELKVGIVFVWFPCYTNLVCFFIRPGEQVRMNASTHNTWNGSNKTND